MPRASSAGPRRGPGGASGSGSSATPAGKRALERTLEQSAPKKERSRRELIPSLVSEIIRWQTPVLHMRRTARRDVELCGRSIAKGDKVVMWYISGNRDESKIERADEFIVDRAKPRQHLAFEVAVSGLRLVDGRAVFLALWPSAPA